MAYPPVPGFDESFRLLTKPETFRREEPEVPHGKIVTVMKLALPATMAGTVGTAVYLSRDKEEMEVKQLLLAAAFALQCAFYLGYVVHKTTRMKCYKVIHRTPYVVNFTAINIINKYPVVAIWLFVPITLYIMSFANELIHSFRRTREAIDNGDLGTNEDPYTADDPSPFYYPDTRHPWKYYLTQVLETSIGLTCFGVSYGLEPSGPTDLLQIGGAMLATDGFSAALGEMLQRYITEKNRDEENAGLELPFQNQMLIALRENISGLQKIAAIASAFITNQVAGFALIASTAGLTRNHKQRNMVLAKEGDVHDSLTERIITYVLGGAIMVVVPYYTFHCQTGNVAWYSLKCPEGRTFFDLESAESVSFGLILSFALAELIIKRRWLHSREGRQPLKDRGRLLNTARLALVECSEINALLAATLLHMSQVNSPEVSADFRKTCYVLGMGCLAGAVGGEIDRIHGPCLTDEHIPQMSPVSNIVFSRQIAAIIMKIWGK